MATVNYCIYWSAKTNKEVRKRYPKPVTMVQARADAIALFRAGKVGEPAMPFSMACVALIRDPKPGEKETDCVLSQVIYDHGFFRAYDMARHEWVYLYDSGKVRPDPWGRR